MSTLNDIDLLSMGVMCVVLLLIYDARHEHVYHVSDTPIGDFFKKSIDTSHSQHVD